MLRLKSLLFNIALLPLIIAIPQFNLHHTQGISEHTCLRVSSFYRKPSSVYEVASFCMSEEIPANYWTIDDSSFSKFTFFELSKQNITSQDLYRWSASIDLIEEYQLYLILQLYTTKIWSILSI